MPCKVYVKNVAGSVPFGKTENATFVTKRGQNLITLISEIVNPPKWSTKRTLTKQRLSCHELKGYLMRTVENEAMTGAGQMALMEPLKTIG